LVGAGIIGVLVARRRQTAELIGSAATGALGRFIVESRQDLSPEAATAGRGRLGTVSGAVLDLLYLLLGYTLLRTPLTDELRLVVPALVAAVVVTAVAGLMWVVLLVRFQLLSGAMVLLIGLLMG